MASRSATVSWFKVIFAGIPKLPWFLYLEQFPDFMLL